MKKAMRNSHNSDAFGQLAESMLRCDIPQCLGRNSV